MSNQSELREVKSEGIHFKNKYKFVVTKITFIPQTMKHLFVPTQIQNLHYNIDSSSVLMSHL